MLGHSWGGVLAIEYALKYQANLRCVVISNMMASIPAYNDYAEKVLMPEMDPAQLAKVKALEAAGKTADPEYMGTLIPMHYEKHILRRPADQWPEPVTYAFGQLNGELYTLIQGPSELGASGLLLNWDRFADLKRITVPTLVIGAKYDTMDPAYMEKMAKELPKGRYLYLTSGSHLAMYDDQAAYFARAAGLPETAGVAGTTGVAGRAVVAGGDGVDPAPGLRLADQAAQDAALGLHRTSVDELGSADQGDLQRRARKPCRACCRGWWVRSRAAVAGRPGWSGRSCGRRPRPSGLA